MWSTTYYNFLQEACKHCQVQCNTTDLLHGCLLCSRDQFGFSVYIYRCCIARVSQIYFTVSHLTLKNLTKSKF